MPLASRPFKSRAKPTEGVKCIAVAAAQILEVGTVVAGLRRQISQIEFLAQLLGALVHVVRLLELIEHRKHVAQVVEGLSKRPLIAQLFENFGRLAVIFNASHMFVEAVVNDTEIRKKTRQTLFIIILGEPMLSGAGHAERFLQASYMCEGCRISDAGARRLPVFSQLLQLLDDTFVVRYGFFVLLVRCEAVCEHSPRLDHQAMVAGIYR